MAIQEIEVQDGYVAFPYFVKEEDVELAVACFSSLADRYISTDAELTELDRARLSIKNILSEYIVIYQKDIVLKNAEIKTDIVI